MHEQCCSQRTCQCFYGPKLPITLRGWRITYHPVPHQEKPHTPLSTNPNQTFHKYMSLVESSMSIPLLREAWGLSRWSNICRDWWRKQGLSHRLARKEAREYWAQCQICADDYHYRNERPRCGGSVPVSTPQDTQPVILVVQTPPTLPVTPPRPSQPLPQPTTPQVTQVRPPAGYYRDLDRGEVAATAVTVIEEQDLPQSNLRWALATAEPELTLKEALTSPDAEEWHEALAYENYQLEKLRAWTIVKPPPHINIIPSHYMLATKRCPDGKKIKLRIRLVANRQHQKHGLDYSETFTPTTNMTTIHTVLTMAGHQNWKVVTKVHTLTWNFTKIFTCMHHRDISNPGMKGKFWNYNRACMDLNRQVLNGQKNWRSFSYRSDSHNHKLIKQYASGGMTKSTPLSLFP